MIHHVMNITNDDQKTLQKGFYTYLYKNLFK